MNEGDGEHVHEAVGMSRSPVCGDAVKVSLSIDRHRVIVGTGYHVFGCASAMVRVAKALRRIVGKTVEEARVLAEEGVARAEGGGDDGHECVAPETAVMAAIDAYTRGEAGRS